MELFKDTARAGQSRVYLFTFRDENKQIINLTGAAEVRLHYTTSLGSGYWDLTNGVTIVDLGTVRYFHEDLPEGKITLDVWVRWATSPNLVRITKKPVTYTVEKFPV